MKNIVLLGLTACFALVTSCAGVQVQTDYDSAERFEDFKTYAFLKEGIDEAKLSDLDKRRVMHAIDAEMQKKGYVKSERPDVIINFSAAQHQVMAVQNYYGRWGYSPWGINPYMWSGYAGTSTSKESVLVIDVLKSSNKTLIWQGKGSGYIPTKQEKKETKIQEFVEQILKTFPVR